MSSKDQGDNESIKSTVDDKSSKFSLNYLYIVERPTSTSIGMRLTNVDSEELLLNYC